MSQDVFTYAMIREIETELLSAGDEHKASAVYEAMHAINSASDDIRRAVTNIRSGLDRVMDYLDNGNHVYEAHEVSRAAELDIAITKRALYFQQLVALIGQDKVKELLAK